MNNLTVVECFIFIFTQLLWLLDAVLRVTGRKYASYPLRVEVHEFMNDSWTLQTVHEQLMISLWNWWEQVHELKFMNGSWTHIHEPVKNGSWTRGFNNLLKKDSWFGSWTNDERFMHLKSRKIHDLVHELMMNDSCTLTDYVVHELFIRHSWLCFKELMRVFSWIWKM